MSDWYKVYKVSEEIGATDSDTNLSTYNKIKSWIDANFSDMLETTVTYGADSTKESSHTIYATLNVYPKGMHKVLGFYCGCIDSNTQYTSIGIKKTETSVANTTKTAGTNVDNLSVFASLSDAVNSLMMKVIRLKQCYIVDFYGSGSWIKKCRFMVADVNGEKVSMIFDNGNLICAFANSTANTGYGAFLTSQSLEKKNLTKFIFPWTDTWAEGFYETDSIVDNNKPYILNGKTYVDICGGTNYRGIACEVIEGDNDLLYASDSE
jgi:hypothetical protein